PIVGCRLSNGNLPFQATTAASLSHHEVQYIHDHELQLDQVITAPMPKIPLDFYMKMFSASTHGLRNRIVQIFLRTFHNERLPLVIHYGVLVGLCEMGQVINK
ncbi:unnamed protein product, partial [Adineta steineri]